MVFSSIPAYLDPSQWHQQANHQSAAASSSIGGASSFQFISHTSPPPPPAQASHGGGGGGAGSIRPGSMVDRARMANLPMPESALKCPRCESTNTKFCYFNNYSLSQPRHFCKTCRRYWTRGGALRSVPVGGGYRRNNKRPSKSNSKSPVNSQQRQVTSDPEASSLETQIPSSKFISPLHHQLTDGDHHRMSLNYSRLNNYSTAISAPNNGAGGDLNFPNFSGFDQIQWRLQLQLQQTQQPPLLATSAAGGLFGSNTMGEASSSYNNNNIGQIQQKMEEAKMEENGNEEEVKMGIGRQFLGVSGSDNHHYWSGFAPSYSHT